jgi:hypothetical protein
MSEETFQSLNGYYMYRGFNNLKCPHFAPPPPPPSVFVFRTVLTINNYHFDIQQSREK